ncbi:N-acetylmuramidase domain-containing protein [Aquibium sp. LZ166]|uniref:N-acetylmuramidase domain-containing protein n=1 Tax=Aquibium pacificus TaxID=3153579 RepID=A0ABV3SBL3_9HYPH
MFEQETIASINRTAEEAGLEPAALLAVAEVESAGKAFATVGGRREPLIRFEGHYFDRRLTGAKQAQARAAGLASPKAGGVANPRTQAGRWDLLERACAIDRKAAWESVSWGLGQVMGAHWLWLGYANVEALVGEARSGVAGQARLMVRYIDKTGLRAAIERRDWAAFAKGYNGPAYKKHGYDTRIAAAYERHRKAGGGTGKDASGDEKAPDDRVVIRSGDRGAGVAELQKRLSAAGHPCAIDGVFGPATAAAVRRFQRENGLSPDGIAGPRTLAALRRMKSAGEEEIDFWLRLRAFVTRLLRAA